MRAAQAADPVVAHRASEAVTATAGRSRPKLAGPSASARLDSSGREGTGTGKTTLLNALAKLLPDADRIVVIEETAELQFTHANLVRFEGRRAQPDLSAVTIRDLLRASLRHRPDRIIVGEVRGGEAFDLLQTLNTGHSGSLSTIHANSAELALARFASCVLQSGVDLPYPAIRRLISESIDLVLHLERRRGLRSVTEVVSVAGYQADTDTFDLGRTHRGVRHAASEQS